MYQHSTCNSNRRTIYLSAQNLITNYQARRRLNGARIALIRRYRSHDASKCKSSSASSSNSNGRGEVPCNLGDAGEHEGLEDGQMEMHEFLCSIKKAHAGASTLVILVGCRPFGGWEWSLQMTFTRWDGEWGRLSLGVRIVAGLSNLRLSTDCPSPSRDSYQSFVLA